MFKLLLSIFSFLLSYNSFAQPVAADKILGEWLNEERDTKIEIYKSGNLYFGKIAWGSFIFEDDKKTLKKDIKNPNKKLVNRPLENLVIYHQFEFEDDIWDDGKMYDYKSGKTYHCYMKISDGKLQIRAYVGIPLFGRTTYWEKSE